MFEVSFTYKELINFKVLYIFVLLTLYMEHFSYIRSFNSLFNEYYKQFVHFARLCERGGDGGGFCIGSIYPILETRKPCFNNLPQAYILRSLRINV